ncbi:hypothetical protein [Sphingomonas sp. 10B4]|uniref:hypothetical protein n=1 Tax=Sphingomonas sp. 10B4 TaxID=3048575 RepID=UPI002AB3C832|nr:hypothetical protein [Sphingomonas sp. 10B4]MDY7525473.1 hypothetical protein [Sphingomonas sp. 10B4]MEB0281417.1 hypothetical protein [Sphingomonas sp. 10B4]
MEDALSPHLLGSTQGMTLQVLTQIRDSLSAMSRDIRANSEATSDVRERVIRLEERDRRFNDLEERVHATEIDITDLKGDKNRREGAHSLIGKFPNWLSVMMAIASIFSAVWLFGRSVGVVPPPPTPASITEPRRIPGIGDPPTPGIPR